MINLIEEILLLNCGHILEHSKTTVPLLNEYHNHGILRKLTRDEVHETTKRYFFDGVYKHFVFSVNGDDVVCLPEDMIGPSYSLKLAELQLSYIEPSNVFNRFAIINGFSSPSPDMYLFGNNLRPIGVLVVSNRRVEWFFVKSMTDLNSEYLRGRNALVLISSYDQEVKRLCEKNDLIFLPVPNIEAGFKIQHRTFMTRIRGFRADDLARLSQAPIVLDSEQGQLYFYGKKHSRNSQNDYKYVSTIIEHPEEMDGNTLTTFLSDVGDVRTVLNQWRKELKKAIKKTLGEGSHEAEACFELLGLGEVGTKGLYSSNLKQSDYIIF